MKKIIKNIFGFILIFAGIISGPIPIMQGWIFVLTGYIILDLKKKDHYETKVITFLNKNKFTKKLADLWLFVKMNNINLLSKITKISKKFFKPIEHNK